MRPNMITERYDTEVSHSTCPYGKNLARFVGLETHAIRVADIGDEVPLMQCRMQIHRALSQMNKFGTTYG